MAFIGLFGVLNILGLFRSARLLAASIYYWLILGLVDSRIGGRLYIRGRRNIDIGRNFLTNGDVWIEALSTYGSQVFNPSLVIGHSVRVTSRLHISATSSITIGNHCLIGSNVYIGDNLHGCYSGSPHDSPPLTPPAKRDLYIRGKVVIGDNVWIGNNVIILGPAVIGSGSIVGANSLVTGTHSNSCMLAGNPARCIKIYNPLIQSWIKTTPH